MFRISTVNLSADAATANAAIGAKDGGEIAADKLVELLERFRALDSIQNHEAEPAVVIVARTGKYLVRTGRGKLFLCNARDSLEPYAELSAPDIVRRLDPEAPIPAPPEAEGAYVSPAARRAPTSNRAVAVAVLVAAVALNSYTVTSIVRTDSVNEVPALDFVVDPAEVSNRQRELEGRYATGDRPGDRIIVVKADGTVQFSELGTKAPVGSDRFRLARRNGKLCLATGASGVIDVLNIESLVYYRDTYRRTR